MAQFLHGKDLSEKIEEVLKGKTVKCAVAFWGDGSDSLFGSSKTNFKNAKIICDISMGCTSHKALKQLNGPDNKNLRQHDNFHAKLYVSDYGAIVASANASNNGIGLNGSNPKLEEAGVFLDPDTDRNAYDDVISAFNEYYENSTQVDEETIQLAKKNWKARKGSKSKEGNSDEMVFDGSLLALVKTNPELFHGYGFVLSDEEYDERKFKAGKKIAEKELSPEDKKSLLDCSGYTGHGVQDAEWPYYFVSLHLPDSKLEIGLNKKLHWSKSAILTKNVNWSIFKNHINKKSCGKLGAEMNKNTLKKSESDRSLIKQLLGRQNYLFLNAYELRAKLNELEI